MSTQLLDQITVTEHQEETVFQDIDKLRCELKKGGFINFFKPGGEQVVSMPTQRIYEYDQLTVKATYHFRKSLNAKRVYTVYAVKTIVGELGYYSPNYRGRI